MRKRNLPEALAFLGHLGPLASPDYPVKRKKTGLSENSHAKSIHSYPPAGPSSGRMRAFLPHCRLGLSSHLLHPKTWVPGPGEALAYCDRIQGIFVHSSPTVPFQPLEIRAQGKSS